MTKRQELLRAFTRAIKRLDEALKQPKNEFIRDSAIQRFEFTFDLAWKTVKAHLEEEGIRCASPKACFQDAYRQGLIDYQDIWLEMIEMRNETVHTYNEEVADKIFGRLPDALAAYQKLLAALKL